MEHRQVHFTLDTNNPGELEILDKLNAVQGRSRKAYICMLIMKHTLRDCGHRCIYRHTGKGEEDGKAADTFWAEPSESC